jgi:hypothetical protein
MLFSANSGLPIHASELASSLLVRAEVNVAAATDWLLQMLGTKDAKGLFKAAIWGMTVDAVVQLPNGARLIPTPYVPDSGVKQRIEQRARTLRDNWVWLSQTHYSMPSVMYVAEVEKFPYIRGTDESFRRLEAIEADARDCWSELEALSAGRPLVIGYWFEYENKDLDYMSWENTLSWSFPEIVPQVMSSASLSGTAIAASLRKFAGLPGDLRKLLRRSMHRFTLSQCRHQSADRILDLALAFEIAVGGGPSDNAPPSWKVAVRTAQMVGGPLAKRQANRELIAELYGFRNRATHGGKFKPDERLRLGEVLVLCTELYRDVLRSFLDHGKAPVWKTLELEPRTTKTQPALH